MIPSDRQNINKARPGVAKWCEKVSAFPLTISDYRRTLQTGLPTRLWLPSPAPTRGKEGRYQVIPSLPATRQELKHLLDKKFFSRSLSPTAIHIFQ